MFALAASKAAALRAAQAQARAAARACTTGKQLPASARRCITNSCNNNRNSSRNINSSSSRRSSSSSSSSSRRVPRLDERLVATGTAVAAAALLATTSAAGVALCRESSDGEPSVNWKLTLGLGAAAAVVVGGVATLLASRSSANDSGDDGDDGGGGDSDDGSSAGVDDGGAVSSCKVLPMPTRGLWKPGASSIVLGNEHRTRVSWGVASDQGPRQHMEDEWCAGIIVPQVVVEPESASTSISANASASNDDTKRGDGDATPAPPAAALPAATKEGDPLFVVGVFDGHGGGACSKHAAMNLLSQVGQHITRASQVRSPQGVVDAAISELEKQMTGPAAVNCGTTVGRWVTG